jgi:hypothetical protein
MRIDMDLTPMGPERMMQRMQELRAQLGATAPAFSLPTGESGLSGNLPGAGDGFKPVTLGPGTTLEGQAPGALKSQIEKAANDNGVDPLLLDALVAVESDYNPQCRSSAGAIGLTQLMPENVREMGISNPTDPAQNLDGGARYLAKMMAKYKDLPTALAAYNAGPGAVDRAGGKIPNYRETQHYVQKVMGLYKLRKGQI